MLHLKLIYDFADRFPRIGVMLFPLILVAIGLCIFFYNKNIVAKGQASKREINRAKYGKLFGVIFTSITGVIVVFGVVFNLVEYFKTKKVYDNKKYQMIEGKVEHYHPMPEGGHDSERFDVKGIHFEFSDYDLSDYGYNNAASKGGAIKEGLHVKIGYFNNGDKNVILRLETE